MSPHRGGVALDSRGDRDRDRDGTTTSVSKVYVVKRGDTLHSIAIRECGSGAAVDSLVEVNVGREQPDGRIMKDPDLLHPGWRIVLSCQTVRD